MDQGKAPPEQQTFRRFKTGESVWDWPDLSKKIFQADRSTSAPPMSIARRRARPAARPGTTSAAG